MTVEIAMELSVFPVVWAASWADRQKKRVSIAERGVMVFSIG
jgi:hypothetical protein